MSANPNLKPPDISISRAPEADPITPEEQDRLRSGTRTPRPYHHDKEEIKHVQRSSLDGERPPQPANEAEEDDGSGWIAGAGSESGTEADDERSSFVKAFRAAYGQDPTSYREKASAPTDCRPADNAP